MRCMNDLPLGLKDQLNTHKSRIFSSPPLLDNATHIFDSTPQLLNFDMSLSL